MFSIMDAGVATKRLPKSETTIARILAAASGQFVGRAYADVTMNQIARAAKVTKGALYHHFTSKEELYVAMMRSELADKERLFRDAIGRGRTCRERLGNLVESFLTLEPEKRNVMKLVRRDINIFQDPVRTRLIRSYQRALPEQVEEVLRAGVRSGELKSVDPRLLSWHFVSLVEVILTPYADSVFPNANAGLTYVLDLFFRGAAATPSGETP